MRNTLKYLSVYFALSSYGLCDSETPEQFCEKYIDSLRNEGLMAAPRFIHSEELQRFKSMFITIFDPNHEFLNQKDILKFFFGADATYDTVASTTPYNLLSRVIYLSTPHTKGFILSPKILGSVTRNEDNSAYVVIQIDSNIAKPEVEILSLRREGADWKLLLSSEFESMLKNKLFINSKERS
ncbi:hypothetical protein [Methylomonas albis]|uniref:DUF3828 domain-containing protein n=1 Tax=Methylomonas albis TaxID=1854563 RepID=A0ABR9CVD3_9GAMM|nr:hypothetical protein [Methylomonas albis]MBD9354386.1 hypothetical protein [Methylomonas albis]